MFWALLIGLVVLADSAVVALVLWGIVVAPVWLTARLRVYPWGAGTGLVLYVALLLMCWSLAPSWRAVDARYGWDRGLTRFEDVR